jgi:S-adenosylmethionine:tRNA ribosyltransferase-isomerase
MHPQNISISDYNYDLPDSRIAIYPLPNRDASKLLIYKDKQVSEKKFYELPTLLSPETLLIFNNTKVAKVRLLFEKETGAKIEIFCLEPAENLSEMSVAMLQTQKAQWKCLVGGAQKWKTGKLQLAFSGENENVSEVFLKIFRLNQKKSRIFLCNQA